VPCAKQKGRLVEFVLEDCLCKVEKRVSVAMVAALGFVMLGACVAPGAGERDTAQPVTGGSVPVHIEVLNFADAGSARARTSLGVNGMHGMLSVSAVDATRATVNLQVLDSNGRQIDAISTTMHRLEQPVLVNGNYVPVFTDLAYRRPSLEGALLLTPVAPSEPDEDHHPIAGPGWENGGIVTMCSAILYHLFGIWACANPRCEFRIAREEEEEREREREREGDSEGEQG